MKSVLPIAYMLRVSLATVRGCGTAYWRQVQYNIDKAAHGAFAGIYAYRQIQKPVLMATAAFAAKQDANKTSQPS